MAFESWKSEYQSYQEKQSKRREEERDLTKDATKFARKKPRQFTQKPFLYQKERQRKDASTTIVDYEKTPIDFLEKLNNPTISQNKKEQALLKLAQNDAEMFFEYLKNINFKKYKNADQVIETLIMNEPQLTAHHFHKLQTSEQKQQQYLTFFAQNKPLYFIAANDTIFSHNKFKPMDKKLQNLATKQLKNIDFADYEKKSLAQTIIELNDTELKNLELNDVLHDKIEEAKQLIASQMADEIQTTNLFKKLLELSAKDENLYNQEEKFNSLTESFVLDELYGFDKTRLDSHQKENQILINDVMLHTFIHLLKSLPKTDTHTKLLSFIYHQIYQLLDPPTLLEEKQEQKVSNHAPIKFVTQYQEQDFKYNTDNSYFYPLDTLAIEAIIKHLPEKISKTQKDLIDKHIKDTIQKTPVNSINYIDYIPYSEKSPAIKKLLKEKLKEDPTVILNYLKGKVNLKKFFSTSEALDLIQQIANYDSFYLAYRMSIFDYLPKVALIKKIQQLRQANLEPFTDFDSAKQAYQLMVIDGYSPQFEPKETRKEKLQNFLKIKKTVSAKTWKFLTKDKEYIKGKNLNKSQAQFLDHLYNNAKNLFDYAEKQSYNSEWLNQLGKLKPEDTDGIIRIVAILEAQQIQETKNKLQKIKKRGNSYFYQDIIDPLKEKLKEKKYFYHTLSKKDKKIITSYQKLELNAKKIFQIYRFCKAKGIDPQNIDKIFEALKDLQASGQNYFILNGDDMVAREKFIKQYSQDLEKLSVPLKSEAIKNKDLEAIYALPKKQREIFVQQIDFNQLSKGVKLEEVFHLLLKFTASQTIDLTKPQNIENFRQFILTYGVQELPELFKIYNKLRNKVPLNEDEQQQGITKTGKEGLKQLEKIYINIKNNLLDENIEGLNLDSPFILDIIKNLTDYETSEFKREVDFKEFLTNYFEQNKDIAPAPDEYQRKTISVEKRVDEDSLEISLSKPSLEQFKKFQLELSNILTSEDHFINLAKNEIQSLAGQKTSELQKKLQTAVHEKKRESLQKQIDSIVQLNQIAIESDDLLTDLLNFDLNNKISNQDKMSTAFILQLLFMKAVNLSDENFNKAQTLSREKEPTINDYEILIEFINNTIKQHAIPAFDFDSQQRKYLHKILSSKGLQEEIKRFNQGTGKFVDFEIIPSRKFLAEFSGYYGDACWTSRTNIMRDNPDMLALAFVIRPDDDKTKRLAGSTLLIETTVNNEPALVIRGLNPKQNIITELLAEDFIDKIIEYLTPICKKRGIKKILAPVKNKGALSNRPNLNDEFEEKYKEKQITTLDKPNDFNGYQIEKSCVVIAEI